jgi:SAM-dependent methyltransferase
VNLYEQDLAYIHDAGHGHLAKAAARRLIQELRTARLFTGTVVDVGCGSGILAREVTDAGYSVVGFDTSDSMIALARERSPKSTFRVGSFVSAEFPECVAVTAVGEVLNYRSEERNDVGARAGLFRRINNALVVGGLLLFDVAGLERSASAPHRRTWSQGEDWAVLVEVESDQKNNVLTRSITSFRKVGECYRRQNETHRLQLLDPNDVMRELGSAGFQASTFASYWEQVLPAGMVGFRAQKPL